MTVDEEWERLRVFCVGRSSVVAGGLIMGR